MDFIEYTIADIDGEAAETVAELFNKYGIGGAIIEAYPPEFVRVSVRTVLAGDDPHKQRELEAMLSLVGMALPNGLPEPQQRVVGESDWTESWKENFHVVRIGQRFVIQPSWREYAAQPDDIVLEIDPGLAFGSGLHPTTRVCLMILEQMFVKNYSVFDVGTGSGILCMAARRLGAGQIRAVDIDDVAVRVAEENFARNQISDIETAVGSASATGGQTWQIVVANILAHILIELMPDLAQAVALAGRLILSGMMREQEADVRAAASAQGLQVIERFTDEDWVALIAIRR